jgi:single-strand DNA-binding protein
MSLNKVTLIGRLGKDPEVKNLTNGSAVANFSVATSEKWKDKRSGEMQEKTEWHNIVVWNEKTIEFIEKWLKKGDLVYLEGKIQTRKWEDSDGKDRYSTEIVIPQFAGIEALQKLNFDNDSNGGADRGSSRSGSRDDDRGSDRGGRSTSRGSSSRGRDDDRSDDRGGDDRGGRASSSRGGSSRRDNDNDRNDDRRDPPRRAAAGGARNADMDDDIPF